MRRLRADLRSSRGFRGGRGGVLCEGEDGGEGKQQSFHGVSPDGGERFGFILPCGVRNAQPAIRLVFPLDSRGGFC